MADLLTHVLAASAVLTALGWRIDWLDRRWVVVGMCGAAIPDLRRIGLLVDDRLLQEALGVPFRWAAVHTLGGVLLVAAAVALLFDRRRRAYAALLLGGGSHLVLDSMRMYADGRAGFLLYPLWWRPPTPNLYVSADWWPPVLALAVAGVVFWLDRRRPRP